MRTSPARTGESKSSGVLFSMLAGALLVILIACGALSLTPTIASAFNPSPTIDESQSWSVVEIAKPTQTAEASQSWSVVEIAKPTQTATVAPTSTPLPPDTPVAPTETAEASSSLTMNIVEETATSAPGNQAAEPAGSTGKYILVSISQQHMYAYENGTLIYSFVVSTGSGNSTRTGIFHVLDKIPNAYGANWNIWMPNWMGIYWVGTLENGIHALPILPGGARLWSGYLGTPISYGCVVLGVDDALQLYHWTDVGTTVEIRR